jgi:hypothetical protein
MRKAVVDGVEFECPRYVVRVPGGWQVRMPQQPTVFFADSRYGGPAGSHDIAVKRRAACMPISPNSETRYALAERSDKKDPLGIPGVFLVHQPRRGKRAPQVELLVSVKGQPTRTIYVGTQATWEKRLPEKLQIAAAVRAEKIRLQAQKVAAAQQAVLSVGALS